MGLSSHSHYVFKYMLDNILILLHPAMPYITEELYSTINNTENIDTNIENNTTILENPHGWAKKIELDFTDEMVKSAIDDFTKANDTLAKMRMVDLNKIKNLKNMEFLKSALFDYKIQGR